MTLKASSEKPHAVRRLFFHSLGRNLGLTVLITVAAILVCPVYAVTEISRICADGRVFDFNSTVPEALLVATVASLAAVMLYLFINFSYLYGRSSSDFYHSLPITRCGLLLVRLLVSIIPILIPMLAVYGSLCTFDLLPYINCDIKLILTGFAYNLLAIIALTGFTLIFVICAGSVFELLLSFLTVNIGVVIIQVVICSFCQEFLRGFSYSDHEELFAFSSSPYLYVFDNYYELLRGELTGPAVAAFTVKLVLLGVASYAAAFALYKHRKSERSGAGYAYGFLYTVSLLIVSCVCAVVLGMIFSEGEITLSFWIFAAIGGVISAVAFAAVHDRGFKQFKKSALMGGLATALLGVAALLLVTDCFGYNRRIPAAEAVESVTVEFADTEITLTDPATVRALHGEIIEEAEGGDDTFNAYGYVQLDYLLKNGRHLTRYYTTDYADHSDTLLELYTGEDRIAEIRRQAGEIKSSKYISQYLNYTDGETASTEDVYEKYNTEIAVTSEQLEAFVEAYISDVGKSTVKSVCDENVITYYVNGVDENMRYIGFHLRVESGFENTLKAARELGFKTDLP